MTPAGGRRTPTGGGRCSGRCWRRNISASTCRGGGRRKSAACWMASSGWSLDDRPFAERAAENQHGDIMSLKDYANDDDAAGSEVINALIQAHCYWIREADVDGFRVDAVKHMGELACSRFSSMVREYAYSLGKRRFFLFGEL